MTNEPVRETDLLLRRITRDHINNDLTINSAAFKLCRDEGYLSVDIERLTSVDECLARSGRKDLGVVRVPVSLVLENGLTIACVHCPATMPTHE